MNPVHCVQSVMYVTLKGEGDENEALLFVQWWSFACNDNCFSALINIKALLRVALLIAIWTGVCIWVWVLLIPRRRSVGGIWEASLVSRFLSSQINVPTWRLSAPLRCANDLGSTLKMPTRETPAAGLCCKVYHPIPEQAHRHIHAARDRVSGAGCKLGHWRLGGVTGLLWNGFRTSVYLNSCYCGKQVAAQMWAG